MFTHLLHCFLGSHRGQGKARASSAWNLQDIGLTPSGCYRVGLCGKPRNGFLITVSICFPKTTITPAPALETAVAPPTTTTKVSLACSFHREEHIGIGRVPSGNSLFYSCLYNLPQNLICNLCLWFACIEPNLCRVCLRSRAGAGLSQKKHICIAFPSVQLFMFSDREAAHLKPSPSGQCKHGTYVLPLSQIWWHLVVKTYMFSSLSVRQRWNNLVACL